MDWPLAVTIVGCTFSIALMLVGIAWAGNRRK